MVFNATCFAMRYRSHEIPIQSHDVFVFLLLDKSHHIIIMIGELATYPTRYPPLKPPV